MANRRENNNRYEDQDDDVLIFFLSVTHREITSAAAPAISLAVSL